MQKNAVNKVGYMVHLSSERDDSIDLDLKQQVLSTLLENVRGLEVAEYLSYKSNPSVAQYFRINPRILDNNSLILSFPQFFIL
ncbi:hypothetical protein [Niallia alba]|uniref:Uncharacterized protein n=1 Tax=Niallia alba TaxID=2729105 RepID=A0A7Y0PKX6_9BACI|nr:hypothetical protein [Niallia alba]NMO75706.1 hypothetical protein [Niallia alba]